MANIRMSELNRAARTDAAGWIQNAETQYHERIHALAQRVTEKNALRIVLVAGPSASGKTTTANLLSDAIKARGENCRVISLDDFYRDHDDPDYPRFPSGERNLECVEALDLGLLSKVLSDLAYGRAYSLPKYDFKQAKRVSMTEYPADAHGCAVIEGLHALNPAISSSLPADCLLKLFVSVSTNIVDGRGRRILSGRKIRFIRRMVRDNLYRAATAERTLALWEDVLMGEDKYLYPFRGEADICFDTFHGFDLAVMRPFALRLLTREVTEKNSYARVVEQALRRSASVPIDLVPEDSLIREFIPGGVYENLY